MPTTDIPIAGSAGAAFVSLSVRQVRRLALLKAGLLRPDWCGLPNRAPASGPASSNRAHAAAQRIVEHFGYLQLDTVAIAGARTQGIVLASRLQGFHANTAEELLFPGAPLFEYWGHEACWIPLSLYPAFAFRRREFHVHPWWGNLLSENKRLAKAILERARLDGPFRSLDLEGARHPGWWSIKLAKRIAEALWSTGALVISERKNFQRTYDLPERVLPADVLNARMSDDEAYECLLLTALRGHGFAPTGLLATTWRLRNRRPVLQAALNRLVERGEIVAVQMLCPGKTVPGWLAISDLELVSKADKLRICADKGVLLSPFDPLLWDRARVAQLFDFEQVLEIYKPAAERQFGYYCLPVLAGEQLIARVDLKAHRAAGKLELLSLHIEDAAKRRLARTDAAVEHALKRFAAQVELQLQS